MNTNTIAVSLTSLVILTCIAVLLYGAGVFVTMDPDPTQWPMVVRFFAVLAWLYVNAKLVATAVDYLNEK